MSQPGQARWNTAPPTGMMGTAINTRRLPTHTMAQGHTPPAPPPPPPPTLTPCFPQTLPRQLFPPGGPFQRSPTLPTPTFPPMPPPSQPTPHHTPAHTATVSPPHTPSPRHSHATLSNSLHHHTALILQPNSLTISFKPQNTGTIDKSSA